MKGKIKNIIKNVQSRGGSSSLIFAHTDPTERNRVIKEFISGMLDFETDHTVTSHPDIFGITEEQISGKTIKIEQIHEFIRKIQLKPFALHYKVGFIDQAEKMTLEAQNSLLKTLEEPPQHTVIVLGTTRVSLLLPTIISRCQLYELTANTKESNALTITIQDILPANIIKRFGLAEAIAKEKDPQLKHEKINHVISLLLRHFRKLLLSDSLSGIQKEKYIKIIEDISFTQRAIQKNVNIRLALENLMLSLPKKGEE